MIEDSWDLDWHEKNFFPNCMELEMIEKIWDGENFLITKNKRGKEN